MTEPIAPKLETNPAFALPQAAHPLENRTSADAPKAAGAALGGPFAHTRYRFTTGLRAGEIATIRGDAGQVLLSYRSFASVIGVVAALVSALVCIAGFTAVLFLFAENDPLRAIAALLLTLVFAFFIALLVPRIQVTLYDDGRPALTLSQRTAFPTACYTVATPNGTMLADLRKTALSRLGRNRWTIVQEGQPVGEAAEESLGRALVRKLLGKFHRRFETNLRIEHGSLPAARIVRRPEPDGGADVLELTNDALDRRVAVALAVLVLGREP